MPRIRESDRIKDVYLVELDPHGDARGRFLEFFRKEWFPGHSWKTIQCNRSDTASGSLRGLHYHHRQVDYWYVFRGTVKAAFADLRKTSKTYLTAQTIDISGDSNLGVFIPTGVAHGLLAVTDATLLYVVNQYYDGSDEYGLMWNDPSIAIDWGIAEPVLSDRDRRNPILSEIPSDILPG